jgi:peptidoglycan/xylan/chitin deacetylase (PgdA/CDA1 family)
VKTRQGRTHRWLWLLLLAVAAAAGLAVAVRLAFPTSTPRVSVVVFGRRLRVRPGTTLGQAARLFSLRPRTGALLDVQGRVLRPDAYPGTLLVDSRPAPRGSVLRDGERVTVGDGRNRTEPRVRTTIRATVDPQADPQFFVDLVPGRLVVVRGALSHELVSAHFLPDGRPFPERAVALTFDDGPFPYFTARILAVLRRLHAPATFFLIGRNAAAYPQLVREEVAAGMAIGNHSYDHPNWPPFARLRRWRVRAEIASAQNALARLGIHPVLFRPPGGSYSPYVVHTAAALGLRVTLWSVDPRDWLHGTTARQIVQRVLAKVRAGSIVELHDGGGNRNATLRALPTIINGIRKRGLNLLSLPSAG